MGQMRIVIKETNEDGTTNPAPIEVHGKTGYLAAWGSDCIHEAVESGIKYIVLSAVPSMLDIAYQAGQEDKAKEIKEALNIK